MLIINEIFYSQCLMIQILGMCLAGHFLKFLGVNIICKRKTYGMYKTHLFIH